MLNKNIFLTLLLFSFYISQAQELYIMTEPASNMPTNSLGVRLTNKLMPMQYDNSLSYRFEPEFMYGVNKNLMVHGNVYASNMFTRNFRFEGGAAYAKYRVLSIDDVHRHFRLAAFGKVSIIKNPAYIEHRVKHDLGNGTIHEETSNIYSQEIDLDGNNSGASAGIIATQLLHKLALSATAGYIKSWNNFNSDKPAGSNNNAMNYSLSAGYLLFPKTYKNYRQTNVNLYLELLGATGLDQKSYYVDASPGIQFILNSISRVDVAYRTQLTGDMLRYNKTTWLLRYEYTFLNLGSKKTK